MDTRLREYDDSGGYPGMTLGERGRRSGSGSLGGHCGVRDALNNPPLNRVGAIQLSDREIAASNP